jgi:hypothetical protein
MSLSFKKKLHVKAMNLVQIWSEIDRFLNQRLSSLAFAAQTFLRKPLLDSNLFQIATKFELLNKSEVAFYGFMT